MISVVIPAHNESTVIRRGLDEITKGACPGELDVVVVCNGCSDNTAELARRVGSPVRVVETVIGNKAHALNVGDAAAGSVFPRVYMDADVLMNLEGVRALVRRLERGDVLFAAPTARMVVERSSLLARWYYDIAALLPSARDTGSGVYAVSREGHRRFAEFPDLIADDAYVKLSFKSAECGILESVTSTVFKPRRLRDILRVTIRIKQGHRQVAEMFPALWRDRSSNCEAILSLFRQWELWPKLALYCGVVLVAQLAVLCSRRRRPHLWLRDGTTR